jgi:uncharacterized protein YjbI with pentapeptide repeats
MPAKIALLTLACLAYLGSAGFAQDRPSGAGGRPYRHTIWDLDLGSHARELSRSDYVDFACGTNGGPPSIVLRDWREFATCKPEPATGLREVYFRYDDELEYRSLARDPEKMGMFRFEGTSEFQIPVIVSGLFDEAGFLVGVRVVSDPRTDVLTRERGGNLSGVFMARFGADSFECVDLPRREGESPYRGSLIKERCEAIDEEAGVRRVIEKHYYRKPGQNLLDPVTGQRTIGYFVSETRYEALLLEPIENPQERLAAIRDPAPTQVELLAARSRDCPGCDLAGANLKRADLQDANLAGANLAGANLHGANLAGADLTGAQLPKANLNKVDLRRAKMAEANLIDTMLYQARLDGADLSGADMSGAAAARLQMIRGTAPGLYAQETDLRYSRISDSDLSGADLSYAKVQQAQFSRTNLKGATLSDTLFWDANLSEANLIDVEAELTDFTGANLRDADLSGGNFTAAKFNLAITTGVMAEGATFKGAELPRGFP